MSFSVATRGSLLRAQDFLLGLQPVVQFRTVFAAALEIDLVRALADLLFQRQRRALFFLLLLRLLRCPGSRCHTNFPLSFFRLGRRPRIPYQAIHRETVCSHSFQLVRFELPRCAARLWPAPFSLRFDAANARPIPEEHRRRGASRSRRLPPASPRHSTARVLPHWNVLPAGCAASRCDLPDNGTDVIGHPGPR